MYRIRQNWSATPFLQRVQIAWAVLLGRVTDTMGGYSAAAEEEQPKVLQ